MRMSALGDIVSYGYLTRVETHIMAPFQSHYCVIVPFVVVSPKSHDIC